MTDPTLLPNKAGIPVHAASRPSAFCLRVKGSIQLREEVWHVIMLLKINSQEKIKLKEEKACR